MNEKGILLLLAFLLVFGYVLGNLGSNFYDLGKALLFYTMGVRFRDYEEEKQTEISAFITLFLIGIILNGLFHFCAFSFAIQNSVGALIRRKFFSMMGYLIEPMAAYGIFGIFSRCRIKSMIINKIAGYAFGVYLFHESPLLRQLIWINILKPFRYYNSMMYFPYVAWCVALIFICGSAIDFIRETIYENAADRVCDKLVDWFKNTGCK